MSLSLSLWTLTHMGINEVTYPNLSSFDHFRPKHESRSNFTGYFSLLPVPSAYFSFYL